MSTRAVTAGLVLAVVAVTAAAGAASSTPASSATRIEPAAFEPIVVQSLVGDVRPATSAPLAAATQVPALALSPVLPPVTATRPAAEQAAQVRVEKKPQPKPKPKPKPVVHRQAKAVVRRQAKPVVRTVASRTPSVAAARSYALSRIGSRQYSCLNSLFTRESGWNPRAYNASSGAYGIPQALPGGKMASAGADWRTNPVTQVRWGLSYISAVYGSACNAWGHSERYGWY